MSRHDRIAQAIKHSKKLKKDIAALCGVSASAVTQWVNGDSKALRPENLFALAKATGVSAEWLANGTGAMVGAKASSESNVEPGPPITSAPRRIEIVGTAQMGPDGYWMGVNESDGWVETYSRDEDAYALRLRGDSMAPAIRNGWVAVCEPNHRLVPGEYVMVTTTDGQSMVKELLFQNDEEVSLMSVNAAYGERRTIERNDIEKIHYVGNILAPSKVLGRY